MKKTVIFLVIIFLLSGCTTNQKKYTTSETQETVNSTQTAETYFSSTSDSPINTSTIDVIENKTFPEAVIEEMNSNPDIAGGMCIDLNFDNFPEVIFIIDSPEGISYSIYYYSNAVLEKNGEFFDWLNWDNKNNLQPELKLYCDKTNNTYFYYAEKNYAIKDVTSAVCIEATSFVVYGKGNPLGEETIMSYKNTDTSDQVIEEMQQIMSRTKKKIDENCNFIKSIPIEMQWSRENLTPLYEIEKN